MKNYYNVLELNPYEESQDVILAKYKEVTTLLSSQEINDIVKNRLVGINEAFLVLSDTDLKKKYDYALSTGVENDEIASAISEKQRRAYLFIISKLQSIPPQKRKKINLAAIICSVLIMATIGSIGKFCSDLNTLTKDPFEASIIRANKDCPISIANGAGQLSSIKLEENYIVYRIDYKPGFVNIDAYKKNPDATRDMFYLSLLCVNGQGGGGDIMAHELIKRNWGLKVIASDEYSSFTATLSPRYIKEMQATVKANPSEALHDAMALKIEVEANDFPTRIDEGLVMTDIILEEYNVVFIIDVDEDIYDINEFATISEEFCQNILNEANAGDPVLGALLDLCKVSHSGLIYRMIGIRSNKHCDLVITSEQIRQQRITPPQLNIK